MRLDLPHEPSRGRDPEAPRPAPPLAPSPIELRSEALAARAADRRAMPQAPQNGSPRDLSREPESERRATSPNRPMDQRPRRQTIAPQAIGLSLREEERKVLTEVGRFRVIATRDLAETVYGNRHARMERDLAFLREKGLICVDTVNARRDGRGGRVERIEVVNPAQRLPHLQDCVIMRLRIGYFENNVIEPSAGDACACLLRWRKIPRHR